MSTSRAAENEDATRAAIDDANAANQRYRLIVERASDIIYEADVNGFFTYVNPVAVALVGRELDELIGMHYTELIREDARTAALEFYRNQAMNLVANTYYEFPVVRPDGKEVWIGQNVQLLTRGNEIVGFQAVARDITQQHEEERFKDELLSVVSHELRTPLTSIRATLGLMKGGKLTGDRADHMLTIAVNAADRMTRLLNDFLDLERMRFGQFLLHREAVSLADLLREAAAAVPDAGERIRVSAEPHDARIVVDHDRMIQAIVNLLTNAIKFSDAASPIELTARHARVETNIAVTDHGRGIPADKLALIFEPFRQADQGDARVKGGIGIGLAITRSIVELHGGRIDVESEVGRGTTFRIVLPA